VAAVPSFSRTHLAAAASGDADRQVCTGYVWLKPWLHTELFEWGGGAYLEQHHEGQQHVRGWVGVDMFCPSYLQSERHSLCCKIYPSHLEQHHEGFIMGTC
jgi:hypothetical protein